MNKFPMFKVISYHFDQSMRDFWKDEVIIIENENRLKLFNKYLKLIEECNKPLSYFHAEDYSCFENGKKLLENIKITDIDQDNGLKLQTASKLLTEVYESLKSKKIYLEIDDIFSKLNSSTFHEIIDQCIEN